MRSRRQSHASLLRREVRDGAVCGTLATLVMSVPMLAAGRLGLMGRQPPTAIVEEGLDAVDLDPAPEPVKYTLAGVTHVAFGALCGALFVVGRRRARLPVPVMAQSVTYALGVWATSYLGWIPALGILPRADRDRPDRRNIMVAAHVVYGLALGGTELLAERRGRPHRR